MRYFLLYEKYLKLTNLKSVPSIIFYKKTAKIDRFEKGTHYVFFYEKTANIDKFEKGTPYTFYQKTAKIFN